jgi:hypothetical protein
MNPEEERNLDVPEPAVESIHSDVKIGVSLVHLREEWTQAANDNRSVDIDGREKDPEQMLERLDMATRVIKKITPSFDESKIQIEQLPGQAVGEAKDDVTLWDPWLIADAPVKAIVHTQIHEMAHEGGDVPDEAVVEAMARLRMKEAGLVVDSELTDNYIAELEAFYKMITLMGKGKDPDKLIQKIYELCLSEGAEAVFELFDKEYVSAKDPKTNKSLTDAEMVEAFDVFEAAFPMMSVDRDGCFALREIEEAPEAPAEEAA